MRVVPVYVAAVALWLGDAVAMHALTPAHRPGGEWLIFRQSIAIVEANVEALETLIWPQRRVRSRDTDGSMRLVGLHEYHAGFLYVLRVSDVVKSDAQLSVGSEVLVYTDLHLHDEFLAKDGERVLVALQLVWGTPDEAKLRGTKRISRNPRPPSLEPSDLPDTNLAHAYRVYKKFPISLLKDYDAYKNLLRAQSKPVAWVAQPVTGATVQGNVTLWADGYDDTAISSMQFRLDGADLGAALTERPFRVTWRSKSVANGPHTLTVLARDSTGEETLSTPVTITTHNTNAPPTVNADPPVGSGFTSAFNWNWSDPDGDPLTCTFGIVEFAQCSFAGHCAEAGGGASAGVTPCQARVEYGQPLFTRCTYRLSCSDGWATTTAEFRLN